MALSEVNIEDKSILVSVVIPVFNREGLIEETLMTIANQSLKEFECIIVDDGSEDETVQVITNFCSEDKRFKLICRPEEVPKGAPSCRNLGLAASKGDYIQFFDSDDILLPQALESKVKFIRSEPGLDFIVSKTAFLKEDGSLELSNQRLRKPTNFQEFLENKTSFYTPGPLFQKTYLIAQEKGFETNLPRHQEWEFYTRLMSNMPNFEILDEVHCHYRMHSDSIKANSDRSGNLYYRNTKLLAINYINKNSGYRHARVIKKVFWPYAVTTLKVAVYHFNLLQIIKVIWRMMTLYRNQFKSIR